ncbi:uncharacterized protein LOC144649336 [Oculina patagonica]
MITRTSYPDKEEASFKLNTEPTMFKLVTFKLLISYLVATSLAGRKEWRSLARCLQMSSTGTSPKDILRFIRHRGYMIVPQSNPATKIQEAKTPSKRSVYSGKCPFKMEVKDFFDAVPRFLSSATCRGCDVRCKPVTYTLRLLRKKCGNYWLWEEQEMRVAYVLEQ